MTIKAPASELSAFDREALGVVCGTFAFDALAAVATMGMSMPDWGYSDEYASRRSRSGVIVG